MPRHRLWQVLEEIEGQDPAELESLLIALTRRPGPLAPRASSEAAAGSRPARAEPLAPRAREPGCAAQRSTRSAPGGDTSER